MREKSFSASLTVIGCLKVVTAGTLRCQAESGARVGKVEYLIHRSYCCNSVIPVLKESGFAWSELPLGTSQPHCRHR
jgi:hypothetical protein